MALSGQVIRLSHYSTHLWTFPSFSPFLLYRIFTTFNFIFSSSSSIKFLSLLLISLTSHECSLSVSSSSSVIFFIYILIFYRKMKKNLGKFQRTLYSLKWCWLQLIFQKKLVMVFTTITSRLGISSYIDVIRHIYYLFKLLLGIEPMAFFFCLLNMKMILTSLLWQYYIFRYLLIFILFIHIINYYLIVYIWFI